MRIPMLMVAILVCSGCEQEKATTTKYQGEVALATENGKIIAVTVEFPRKPGIASVRVSDPAELDDLIKATENILQELHRAKEAMGSPVVSPAQ